MLRKPKRLKRKFNFFRKKYPLSSGKRGGRISSEIIIARADKVMINKKLYLRQDLRLKELASEIGTNRTYLYQAIKDRGLCFYDYMNSFRLHHFMEYAHSEQNKSLSVTEIAEKSGFNTTKVLNRCLKKALGITASEYMKRISGGL